MARDFFKVIVDRPMGYQDSYGNIYSVNYGYIPDRIAGDGEEQDVYILSKQVINPIETFDGELMAIIHRTNDVEDKWVLTSPGEELSLEDIRQDTQFIEQYFDSWIELL